MSPSVPPRLVSAGKVFHVSVAELEEAIPLAGDAGTRCYFRLPAGRLLVTYPEPFSAAQRNWTEIRQALADADVRVPALFADSEEEGAALIEDLGDGDLSRELEAADPGKRAALLQEAEEILPLLHRMEPAKASRNSAFDTDFFFSELDQTRHWLLEKGGTERLQPSESDLWTELTRELARRAAGSPADKVPVHRDFHANNILRARDGRLAVIDFQDLRYGPRDYDRVSLRFERGGTLVPSDPRDFPEAVLLQRAWKVAGTFAKLLTWGRSSYRPFFETARQVIRTATGPESEFMALLRFLP